MVMSPSTTHIISVFLSIGILCTAKAFSSQFSYGRFSPSFVLRNCNNNKVCGSVQLCLSIRGGSSQEECRKGALKPLVAPVLSFMSHYAVQYTKLLETRPIIVKSITAGVIFGLSDIAAQSIESTTNNKRGSGDKPEEKKRRLLLVEKGRLLASFLVGLLYFGPAAHVWYNWIFHILPEKTVLSTFYKAALGQLIFGPCFTCVFFAVGLLQNGDFTVQKWLKKIRNDLFSIWAAGLGYWPIVDYVSYAWVPTMWIPLFVNFCSFIWTIYLSLVTNSQNEVN
jgi:protein Mpv17